MKRAPALLALAAAAAIVFTSVTAANATDATGLAVDYSSTVRTLNPGNLAGLSQGGQSELSNLNYIPAALQSLKRSGAKYFRIDHLTDDTYYGVVSGTPGSLSYNFSALDKIVASVYAAGLTPWFAIDFSPKALESSPFDSPTVGGNFNDWKSAVTTIVSHYVTAGHSGLHWEVWNEPNAIFFNGTASDYYDLYAATASAVRAGDSTAKVGGPSVAYAPPGDSDSFLGGFLDYVKSNSVPFDFYSWHSYGGNLPGGVSTVKASLQSRGLWPKELWVTEWGNCSGPNGTAGNCADSNPNAAFVAQELTGALNSPDLTGALYYAPEDTSISPAAALFDGDTGALTSDLHSKSTANALALIGNLKASQLASTLSGSTSGRGAIASKDSSTSTLTVLLYNNSAIATAVSMNLSNLPYLSASTNFKATTVVDDATSNNYYSQYAGGIRGCTLCIGESNDPSSTVLYPAASSLARTESMAPYSVELITLTPTSAAATGPIASTQVMPAWNAASGATVSATSSGGLASDGWAAGNLTDDYENSFTGQTNGWVSARGSSSANTQAFTVDLGTSQLISSTKLWPLDSQELPGLWFPQDFTIDGAASSAGPWTNLVTQSNYNAGAPVTGAQTFTFAQGSYRFVRVTATKLTAANTRLKTDDQVNGTGPGAFSFSGSSWGSCSNYCSNFNAYYGMYEGTNTYGGTTGDYAVYHFNGTSAQLSATLASNRGIANVQVCDATASSCGSSTPVDLYSPTFKGDRQIYDSGTLSGGDHTLKVTVSGTKNSASSGYSIVLDSGSYVTNQYAFGLAEIEVFGTQGGGQTSLDDRDTSVSYSGSGWGNCGSGCGGYVGLYQGTNTYSSQAGDTATVSFTGTRVQLFGVLYPDRGIASVAICNSTGGACGTPTNVDFYGDVFQPNTPVYDSGTLSSGAHTLKLTVSGTHRTGSTDSSVVLDRVLITN